MNDSPAFLDVARPDVPDIVVPRGILPFHLPGRPVRGRLVRLGRLTERQAVEVLTTAGSAAGLGRPEMVGYGGRSGTIYSGLRTGPTGSFRRARR